MSGINYPEELYKATVEIANLKRMIEMFGENIPSIQADGAVEGYFQCLKDQGLVGVPTGAIGETNTKKAFDLYNKIINREVIVKPQTAEVYLQAARVKRIKKEEQV